MQKHFVGSRILIGSDVNIPKASEMVALVLGFRSVSCLSLYLNVATYSNVGDISLSSSSRQIIEASFLAAYASPSLVYKCLCFWRFKDVSDPRGPKT